MSETFTDGNKKQPWEHSIKSYSVEEILETFDQRVPKEKETSKWKLMFQIISKLHVVQVQQMTRHFITQLRNLENSLHFSSLIMSETKLVKFIFRQSHPFYSVLYYNLDMDALILPSQDFDKLSSSMWNDNVLLGKHNAPHYCQLYFLLAVNKDKKAMVKDLFMKVILKIKNEGRKKQAVVDFFGVVFSSSLVEDLVFRCVFKNLDLNVEGSDASCFFEIRKISMQVLTDGNDSLPSWILGENSDYKLARGHFACQVFTFLSKVHREKVSPISCNFSTTTGEPVPKNVNSGCEQKSNTLPPSNTKELGNEIARTRKKTVAEKENRRKHQIVAGENKRNFLQIDTVTKVTKVSEAMSKKVVMMSKCGDAESNSPCDRNTTSSGSSMLSKRRKTNNHAAENTDIAHSSTVSNTKSYSALCDELEKYVGKLQNNPLTAHEISYKQLLSDIQNALSASCNFISIQHQICASILLHIYLSTELLASQKKDISLHCLSMICPSETSLSQLQKGASVHNLEATKDLENVMLNFYINGQSYLIGVDSESKENSNLQTLMYSVLPNSFRAALMFLKNQFQNIDKEDIESMKETNTLITKGNSLVHAYIDISLKTFRKISVSLGHYANSRVDDVRLVLKEMGNLAYDFFDFAQKAAQELMLHEADEWRRGVMNGMARCFHAFFAILVKFRCACMCLRSANESEKFDPFCPTSIFERRSLNEGINTILKPNSIFHKVFCEPTSTVKGDKGMLPIEFCNRVALWATLLEEVFEKSRQSKDNAFQESVYKGIAKIKGKPHICYCLFTACILSESKEASMKYLKCLVELIYKEDPVQSLPRSVFNSLQRNPPNASNSKEQLLHCCDMSVRVFEKCVHNIGQHSKSTASANKMITTKNESQMLLNNFSTIIGALTLYKFARQTLLDLKILKICGMVLLRTNLPIGIAVNASIILLYIFQNVLDESSDEDGFSTLIDQVLLFPGVLYGLKKRVTCNISIPDKRLTSNCIEILKHVIEVFVFAHNRAHSASQVKDEDVVPSRTVCDFLNKIKTKKYDILAWLRGSICCENTHLCKVVHDDLEVGMNLMYICVNLTAMLHRYRPYLIKDSAYVETEEFHEDHRNLSECEISLATNLLELIKKHVSVANRKQVVRSLRFYVMRIKEVIENSDCNADQVFLTVPEVEYQSYKHYWPEGKTSVFCKTLYKKVKVTPKSK